MNLNAPHSKVTSLRTWGGGLSPSPGVVWSMRSTLLVLPRTSSPVSVESKISSRVSLALEELAVCWAWPPSPWVLTVMAYSSVAGLKSTGTVCSPAEVLKVNSAFLNSLDWIMAAGRG